MTRIYSTSSLTLNGTIMSSVTNTIRCTLKCTTGVWSMINNTGFKKYWSASGPGLGPYVEKTAVGAISILADLDGLNTNVCVNANGVKALVSTSYFDIMQISCTQKAYYNISGVSGLNIYLICASLNAGVLTDITNNGFIDIVLTY
jgi:hypothetical protein